MKKIAEFYKALGDETRLKIIQMLAEKELCVCEIIDRLQMSQPAVSHHLKILRQVGLVKDSREGRWIYYTLAGDVFKETFVGEDLATIEAYAEPIKRQLKSLSSSQDRTEQSVCEKLQQNKLRKNKEVK